jgi:hypothetical protein
VSSSLFSTIQVFKYGDTNKKNTGTRWQGIQVQHEAKMQGKGVRRSQLRWRTTPSTCACAIASMAEISMTVQYRGKWCIPGSGALEASDILKGGCVTSMKLWALQKGWGGEDMGMSHGLWAVCEVVLQHYIL